MTAPGNMTSVDFEKYVRLYLSDQQQDTLLTPHYVFEVLPTTRAFQRFSCNDLLDLLNGIHAPSITDLHESLRRAKEIDVEDEIIAPVLRTLGNKLKRRPALVGSDDEADFCCYEGESFAANYSNATALIESKRHGPIEGRYHIHEEDNSDPIWQTLNYLRQINTFLNNMGSSNNVEHAILTDGYLWRIYSKRYTHDPAAYERHFIEFDLEAIAKCPDVELRAYLIKLFGYFLSPESFSRGLSEMQSDSASLETAVTYELRTQAFTALEYLATGLWRVIYRDRNVVKEKLLEGYYGIDMSAAHEDPEVRSTLLKVVYDESIVLLLRLLFVLYAEDRGLFDEDVIPKVIKGSGNILERVVVDGAGIGDLANPDDFRHDYDRKLSEVFDLIDTHYDGRLFSRARHLILCDFDIDDVLYARAIDDLCRVNVKGRDYTVDFASVSVREIGGIYENLLEYRLAIADADSDVLVSMVDKRHKRYGLKRGDLYLVNRNGERKSSGSYYTPDLIVEHLVRTSLDPKLGEIRERRGADFDAIYRDVLDLRICDPAMGSGHMLLACYGRIVDFLRQCLEECSEAGTTERAWDDEIAYDVRTQVARRCIYGVDLNPVAVELAKLVLWMKSFRTDKPFEFFDYNLACGNSLIGSFIDEESSKVVEDTDGTVALGSTVITIPEFEAEIQRPLLERVDKMLAMPRDTVEQVHAVERFWIEEVRPLQEQIAFVLDMRLVKWLVPEGQKWVTMTYEALLQGISKDQDFVNRIIRRDPSLNIAFCHLSDLYERVRGTYRPLHWRVAFPHIAVDGGFDVVLSNPPWDKVKPYRKEFFRDYIEGYGELETKDAKRLSERLLAKNPVIRARWEFYEDSFKIQNRFYRDSYRWQRVRGSGGKWLSGDPNLYKVFIEKIYDILKEGGSCGIVVPDNLNIDKGCTGLRRLLLDHATVRELIMFENRLKLFDIHRQYKFDVLTFDKALPPENHSFRAGFYWYDPIWLDGAPDKDYIASHRLSDGSLHELYDYSINDIHRIDGELETIYELRGEWELHVLRKMLRFPAIGDERRPLHISYYREFDMTNDADLFNMNRVGWPLFQGRTIHLYDTQHGRIERWVPSAEGEARLSKRWRLPVNELPDRTFRIGWRDIAQPTDSRSLICTVVPRGVFCGNKLWMVRVHLDGEVCHDPEIISGVNVILSSFCADFYVRKRIAKSVSGFIVRGIPMPGDVASIRELGSMALPLYVGEEMDAFRDGRIALNDKDERNRLISKLDARVAHLYGLMYEEYQAVLSTFPLQDEEKKLRCLQEYNAYNFEI